MKKTDSAFADSTQQPCEERRAEFLSLDELAFLTGISHEIIEELLKLDIVAPRVREPEPYFELEIIPYIRKVVRLHRHLDISFSSMALVLDLLDRIDGLEQEVTELQARLKAQKTSGR